MMKDEIWNAYDAYKELPKELMTYEMNAHVFTLSREDSCAGQRKDAIDKIKDYLEQFNLNIEV